VTPKKCRGPDEVFEKMKVGPIPENALEYIGTLLGLVPYSLVDTMVPLMLAQTIMSSVETGIFEAVAAGASTADDIAQSRNLDASATRKILRALAGVGYLRSSREGYELTQRSKHWLSGQRLSSFSDTVLHRSVDRLVMNHYTEFLRTGQALRFHARLTDAYWNVYERGQLAQARLIAPELVRRLALPAKARTLLDIGGGHGFYAMEFCNRHPELRATILDLSGAINTRVGQVSRELAARVEFRIGNALTDDFGSDAYDVVLLANLVHHLTSASNQCILNRVAKALRRGGICAILDFVRPPDHEPPGQIESLFDLYFAAGSASGTWRAEDFQEWQLASGLQPARCRRLVTVPLLGLQVACKVRDDTH
jgi:SAM-dependent methyltransferase